MRTSRTSQRMSRQLKATSQKVKSMLTPVITPVIASVKRRFSNKNKLKIAAAVLGLVAGAAITGSLMAMEHNKRDRNIRKEKEEKDRMNEITRIVNDNIGKIEIIKDTTNKIFNQTYDINSRQLHSFYSQFERIENKINAITTLVKEGNDCSCAKQPQPQPPTPTQSSTN